MKSCGTVHSLDVRERVQMPLQSSDQLVSPKPDITSRFLCEWCGAGDPGKGVGEESAGSEWINRITLTPQYQTLIHQWYEGRLLKSQPSMCFALSFVCSLFCFNRLVLFHMKSLVNGVVTTAISILIQND